MSTFMPALNNAYIGAGVSGANAAIRQKAMVNSDQSSNSRELIKYHKRSKAEEINDEVLDFIESEEFNDALTVGLGIASVIEGGVTASAAGTSIIAGAASSGGIFVLALGAGVVGTYLGSQVGDKAGHALAEALGWQKVATEGENVARQEDAIAHQNKNWGLYGALAGILVGAAVAIFCVVTCGTGVIIAAALAGFFGGAIAAAGNAMGQYGENKGTIIKGSSNVYFNNKPVARVGDEIICSDHPSDPPPLIAEGAKTVFANNKQIARLGHRTTCDANINSASDNILETQQTEQLFEIIDSRSRWLRWAVPIVEIATIFVSGKILKKCSTKSKNNRNKNTIRRGDPVDVVTGDYLQQWPLITLSGVLPLTLNRFYRSGWDFNHSGLLGHKWCNEWSQHLIIEGEMIDFINEEGVILTYHAPDDEVCSLNLHDKRYILTGSRSGLLYIFDRNTQQVMVFGHNKDNHRYLSAIKDRKGNAINFHYQADQLIEIHHSDGYRLRIENVNGCISSVHLVSEQLHQCLLTCEYDEAGYLSHCHSFQHGDLYHKYNQYGFMVHWHDTDATYVTVNYNEKGQVLSLNSKEGYFQDEFIYDEQQKKTIYLDAEGGRTEYHYNEDNLVTRIIDPLGHEQKQEWLLKTKISQTDALGRKTYFYHNEFDDITKIEFSDGYQLRYQYDAYGQITSFESGNGEKWQYCYDKWGSLVKVIDPSKRWIELRYGDRGELLRKTLSTQESWRYYYDDNKQLQAIEDSRGRRNQYHIDLLGRLHAQTNADNETICYHHSQQHANPAGSVTEIILPGDIRQHITYNSERLISTVTDGEGKQSSYRYGAFDLLLEHTRPNGSNIKYHYDKLTRLVAITNALGERYQLTRDKVGRIVQETDFTGRTQYYQYDAVGRLVSIKTAGQLTHYTYQNNDLLAVIRYWRLTDSVSYCEECIYYEYDNKQRLIKVTNNDAVVEFVYNTNNELIEEKINGYRVRYDRSQESGQILKQHLDNVNVNYAYSYYGQLDKLQINQHAELLLHYDHQDRDKLWQTQSGFVFAQNYTANGLLHSQAAGQNNAAFISQPGLSKTGYTLIGSELSRHYQYDNAFNVTSINDSLWGERRYQYNHHNQIISAQFTGIQAKQQTFSYDDNLNLIGQVINNELYAIEQQNGRVVRRGNSYYRYNAAGQLIEKSVLKAGFRPKVWKYRWNSRGELISLLTPNKQEWHYAYDAFGRRIRKFQVINGTKENGAPLLSGSHSEETTSLSQNKAKIIGYDYVWSGDKLSSEIPLYADGTPNYKDAIHWLYKDDSFTPVARYQQGKLHYVTSDQTGAPRELFTESGKLAWSSRSECWGKLDYLNININNPLKAANDDTITCQLRFPGQYEDNESGLFYNRHRYYDPETAQYLSPDPIGLLGGINPYGYVHNPTGWVDPLGLNGCGTGKGTELFLDKPGENLNIGAGEKPIQGFYNISNPNHPMAEGVYPGKVEDLSFISTGSQKVVNIDNPYGYQPINSEVLRVLNEDGVLIIRGGDANKYVRNIEQIAEINNLELIEKKTISSQGYTQTDGSPIKSLTINEYTFKKIKSE